MPAPEQTANSQTFGLTVSVKGMDGGLLFAGVVLKIPVNSGLFHDFICNMTYTDFTIYGKIPVCYRAMPNIMVSPAVPYKITPEFFKNMADLFSYSAIMP
jgi:hypothetical protein